MRLTKWMLCFVASLAELRLVALDTTTLGDDPVNTLQSTCDTCLESCDSFYENIGHGLCKDMKLPQKALDSLNITDDDDEDQMGQSRTIDFDRVEMAQPRWIMGWWSFFHNTEAPYYRWAGITTRLATNIFIGHAKTYWLSDRVPHGCFEEIKQVAFFTNSYTFPNIDVISLDYFHQYHKPATAIELYPLHKYIRLYKLERTAQHVPAYRGLPGFYWLHDFFSIDKARGEAPFWLSYLHNNTALQTDGNEDFNCTMWTYVPLNDGSRKAKLAIIRIKVHVGTVEYGVKKLSFKNTTHVFDIQMDNGAPVFCGWYADQKLSYIAYLRDRDPGGGQEFLGFVVARYRDRINQMIQDNPNEFEKLREPKPPKRTPDYKL